MLERVWRKGNLLHCCWECGSVQPLWKAVWRFLKKLNIELPYDPAIPLLGIIPRENHNSKNTCPSMFITALFTKARTWKQPKCNGRRERVCPYIARALLSDSVSILSAPFFSSGQLPGSGDMLQLSLTNECLMPKNNCLLGGCLAQHKHEKCLHLSPGCSSNSSRWDFSSQVESTCNPI